MDNLSKNKTAKKPLSKQDVSRFIGGSGLAVKILYDNLNPHIDPLNSRNLLIFATGPLTGTLWPSSGRMAIVGKSPLTGLWGESHAGGSFGPELKYAGYDLVVIEGRSNKPAYIWIDDDAIEIHSAKELWGRDTYETLAMLREKDQSIQAAVIGPAGEKLVRFASIVVSPTNIAGRTGLGAVMGSKNLKAVAVRGSKGIEVADSEKFLKLCTEAHERTIGSPHASQMAKFGTPLLVGYKAEVGELVSKNHQTGVFKGFNKLKSDTLREKYYVKTRACFGCSMMCKKVYKIDYGPYAGTICGGPEYETIMAFGTNCLNDDFGSILKCNLLSNQYGMDTISLGCTIAWLMECYEKGLVKKDDCDELDLSWGNQGAIIELIHKIARRSGIGDVLAEGSYRAARKIGKGTEKYVMTVKRLEISGQDGRAHRSMGLAHATAARGADHLRSLTVVDQAESEEIAARRFGRSKLPEIMDPFGEKYKGYAIKLTEDAFAIRDTLLICFYHVVWGPRFWFEDFAKLLPPLTGEKEFGSIGGLVETGERIVMLKRAFNLREGLARKDDTLPKRFTHEPMPEGPAKGQVVNLEPMLKDYYSLRGLDVKSGYPKRKKLVGLGMGDVISNLERLGKLAVNRETKSHQSKIRKGSCIGEFNH